MIKKVCFLLYLLNTVLTCCCSRGGFSGWEDEGESRGLDVRLRCDSGPCLIVMWYFVIKIVGVIVMLHFVVVAIVI